MHMNSLDIKYVWSIVRNARKTFITDKSPSLLCYQFGFLHRDDQIEVITNLEKMLKINSSLDAHTNVTEEVLASAGEMLLYLASCPGPVLLSWKEFYKEIFQTFDFQTILLTLNRILKTSDGALHDITDSLIKYVSELCYTNKFCREQPPNVLSN